MSFCEQSNVKSINFEVYKKSIPDCCKLQTYEEHRDILFFCWGLINNIEHGLDPALGCDTCEFFQPN